MELKGKCVVENIRKQKKKKKKEKEKECAKPPTQKLEKQQQSQLQRNKIVGNNKNQSRDQRKGESDNYNTKKV